MNYLLCYCFLRTAVDPEKAKHTGERIARIIDTGIDFTLSNFVARNYQSYRTAQPRSDVAKDKLLWRKENGKPAKSLP